MATFRIALTGDFLNEDGIPACGDAGLSLFQKVPFITYRFLREQSPVRGDTLYWSRFYSLEVTPAHIQDVDGLVVLRPWVRQSAFARGAGDLVVIGRSGAGYDKIDLDACTANDVAVFNAPDALDHSTASSALMFMLALAKKLLPQQRITRQARWDLQAAVLGDEVQGRTLGIVGLGRSGRELARLVAPFAMRILAYSPHADRPLAAKLDVRLCPLAELLRESDFVSLHSRLTDQSRRMIGAGELAMMKPTAYLINVARGELVDESALITVLQSRRIAGAALDVFETEPLPADHQLTKLDNVILTPHWSCSTSDIWRATGRAMAVGMLRAACGDPPENVINQRVLCRSVFQKKLARFRENRAHSISFQGRTCLG